ncbi:hypothetical protein SNEBB_007353 [Seison nebaliae]|nr:hypothetical protein SNEBB_007353 [Seison nebaliae]
MFGGYKCSRNSLITLNSLFLLIASIIITFGACIKNASIISNFSIHGALYGTGAFVFVLCFFGLIATCKHHQVMLFFYIIILLAVFLLQFCVAVGCLTFSTNTQKHILEKSWRVVNNDLHQHVQSYYDCCGFMDCDPKSTDIECPVKLPCHGKALNSSYTCGDCRGCYVKMKPRINHILKWSGVTCLLFSFTELAAVWIAARYRNQRPPTTYTKYI